MEQVIALRAKRDEKEIAQKRFDALFLDHHDRIYGVLYRLLGDADESADLVQEVFLRLYQTPPHQQENNVGAWLYRVATNLGYNALRSRKRQRNQSWLWAREENEAEGSAEPLAELLRHEEQATVRRVLAKLPLQQSQLLLLRQMGFSYAELAEICQIKPQSVGTLLARAGEQFRLQYLAQNKAQ